MPGEPYLSIIVPVFNEEGSVRTLCRELVEVLSAGASSYEIIFVDDGSTDGTWQALRSLEGIRAERFDSNRGKSSALTRGFALAQGSLIITMDGDLQDDPKEIPRFVDALKDYDAVSGWRHERNDPLSKTIPSRIYNLLTRWLTGIPLHDFNCGYKAYRSEAVKGLELNGGLHRYIPVLLYQKGYRVGEIQVGHRPRLHGQSKYGFLRLFTGLADLIRVR